MHSKYQRPMTEMTAPSPLALITGGSSGIGRAIAFELASRGYSLLLVSNQEAELSQTKSEIESQFAVRCLTFCIDLAESKAAAQVFDYCLSHQLEVNILVNNAGILVFSEVVSAPTHRVETILRLHIHTPAMLCRLFGEKMKEKRSGHILNVSSISAVMPYPGISLYGPTKTFMRYFTRAFRHEMKHVGIHVTCLIPGATVTGLYDPQRINIPLAMRLGVMLQPEFVAQKAVKALMNNKAECIPGWLNKVTVRIVPIVPRWLIDLIYRHSGVMNSGRKALS
jgi:hypothetical protein